MRGGIGWGSGRPPNSGFRSSTGYVGCDIFPFMLIRLSILLAASIAAPATAQQCTAEAAVPATFAEVTAVDSPLVPCVQMEGIAVGRLFVADGNARYRLEPVRNNPSSTGHILGFYSDQSFDEPTRVRLVGRIGDCATAQAQARIRERETNSIILLSGFCHYFLGRTIHTTTVEVLGRATLTRPLPDQASATFGNLSPLAPGDVRRRMEAAANRLLGAVRSGDRAALAAMHGGGPTGRRDPTDVERVVGLLLDAPDSPFASLRTFEPTAVEIFGWKPPLWADDAWRGEALRSGDSDAIACFSVRSDAAFLWPIDSKDADNFPGRPYACTRIHIGGTGADSPARYDTDQAPVGAVEP